jgi:orotate phosphoribosyltransferase-like protein
MMSMSEPVKKRGGFKAPIPYTEELIQKIADLAVKGNNVKDISTELKMSYPTVRKFMRSPEYQGEIRNALRQKISQLSGLMVKVLEAQLHEGNLEAVKLGLKVLGAIDADPVVANQANQGITVIMPGAQKPEVVIDASYDLPKGEEGETQ